MLSLINSSFSSKNILNEQYMGVTDLFDLLVKLYGMHAINFLVTNTHILYTVVKSFGKTHSFFNTSSDKIADYVKIDNVSSLMRSSEHVIWCRNLDFLIKLVESSNQYYLDKPLFSKNQSLLKSELTMNSAAAESVVQAALDFIVVNYDRILAVLENSGDFDEIGNAKMKSLAFLDELFLISKLLTLVLLHKSKFYLTSEKYEMAVLTLVSKVITESSKLFYDKDKLASMFQPVTDYERFMNKMVFSHPNQPLDSQFSNLIHKYQDLNSNNLNLPKDNKEKDPASLEYYGDNSSNTINESSFLKKRIEFLSIGITGYILKNLSVVISTKDYIGFIKNNEYLGLPYHDIKQTANALKVLLSNFCTSFEASLNNFCLFSQDYKLLQNSYSNIYNLNETGGLQIGIDYISAKDYLKESQFNLLFVHLRSALVFIDSIPYKKDKTSLEVKELKDVVIKKLDWLKYELSIGEFHKRLFLIVNDERRRVCEKICHTLRSYII